MKIGLVSIESNNASPMSVQNLNSELNLNILKAGRGSIESITPKDAYNYDAIFVFVCGGGTENVFKSQLDNYYGPVYLIATNVNNSLAASMEILSYLHNKGKQGQIIHDVNNDIISKVQDIVAIFKTKNYLKNATFARIGKPSDWLISSDVDAQLLENKIGTKLIDIPIEEFINEINKNEFIEDKYTQKFQALEFNEAEKIAALNVYGALKRLVDKYNLNGLTMRCFDLLNTVHTTSCVALALLNAQGIHSSCEGDVPSLLSMAIIKELTGKPAFQANPSVIDPQRNTVVFAHCTLPLDMSEDIKLDTHYESGIGVALKSEIATGNATIFKASGLLDRYFVSNADILRNLDNKELCRTQIEIKPQRSIDYFFKKSIGNHHIIINENHADLIDSFFEAIN